MSTKHTPGPWHAVKYARSNAYCITLTPGNANGDIANVLFGLGASVSDEVGANARLIAAAPDLLEALMAADLAMAQNGLLACHATRQQIAAVIAKAQENSNG